MKVRKIVINKDCESNLLCEIQRWLREVHKIVVEILVFNIGDLEPGKFCYQWRIYDNTEDWITVFEEYKTYELALEDCLQEALKLIK